MQKLVTITDQKAVTTSLIVAEAFNKRHSDLLARFKAIECSEEFAQRNFSLGSYLDGNKQPRPMYEMTRDGFTFFVMGMTGKRAAEFKERFIAAFNEMERALLEGQGLGFDRRVEVQHSYPHLRGTANPHGLDIRYTLDLTKIVMSPTRRNLSVLERLTGIPLADILPEASETAAGPDYVARFVEECCQPIDPTRRIPFKRLYDHFRRWYTLEIDAGHFGLPSRREVGKRLRALGYDMPDPRTTSGQAFVCGLELAGQGEASLAS